MKLKKIAIGGAFILMAMPAWAGTYYGGFEDTVGGDYDYNDLVFKITGATLNSSGSLFSEPVLNDSGNVFWDHNSSDPNHADDNIGFCIYGGPAGSCEGNGPFDHNVSYLAAADGIHSANDITFTADGAVGTVLLTITADTDTLGWYNLDDPGTIHSMSFGQNAINADASGFGLVGTVNPGATNFYSNGTAATPLGDTQSHFAIFADNTPEPATMALVGSGLLAIGFWRRRKKA